MFKIFYLLLLTALCVKSEEFWDIAVITEHQLMFYLNGTKLNSKSVFTNRPHFTALAYDAVYNNLLFADSQSIIKYDITNKKYSVEAQMASKKIGGVAFDPVKEMFFWTDIMKKNIYQTSFYLPGYPIEIKLNGSSNDLAVDIPTSIAVDSCRGYIYWTNTYFMNAAIVRARFDGTDKEVIVDNDIDCPVGLAIDQNTKKIYWADNRQGIHYSIESADLNGENRKTLLRSTNQNPYSLTISDDSIYWVDRRKTIWKIPKNPPKGVQPTNYIDFSYLDEEFGIAANYPIREQIGQNKCKALTNLSQNSSKSSSNSFNVSTDVDWFCVHGKKVIEKSVCECTLGYIGERCDISVCQNFCVQGDCNFTTEGQAKCKCMKGFEGERCEVDVCHRFCLNEGKCSLTEYNEPECRCFGQYEGLRCETLKIITTTLEPSTAEIANEATVPVRKGDASLTQRSKKDACYNYCLNEGNCSLDVNQNYPVCHCLEKYYGSRCETLKEQVKSQRSKKDACYNYCLNEGNCSLDADQNIPVCHCLEKYYGSRCETLKEQVKSQRSKKDACYNYCLNEGNCSLDADQNIPVCHCLEKYYGSRCETLKERVKSQRSKKDACYNYCLNEGNCSLDVDQNTPVCNCLKNYSGPRCEIPVAQITVCDSAAPYNSQISDDSAGAPTVIVLGVLVALLSLSCIGLIIGMLRNTRYQCTKRYFEKGIYDDLCQTTDAI